MSRSAAGTSRRAAVAGLLVLLAVTPLWLSPLDPVAVRPRDARPAPVPVATHAVAIGPALIYPEALAVDDRDEVLVGTEDGTIYRIEATADAASSRAEQMSLLFPVARLPAQSIGLAAAPAGSALWSATFPLGLQRLAADGTIETIDEVNGVPLAFPDDLALAHDGRVYLSDASTRFNPRTVSPDAPYVLWDLLDGRGNGRLISHDPNSGETVTELEGLGFPSGVAVSPDGSALLIVEVSRYRVLRFALGGAERGTVTIFADRLPGIPDDVFFGPDARVWVTIAAPRSELLDRWVLPYPYLKRWLAMLPFAWQNALLTPAPGTGSLLQLDGDGNVRCRILISEGAPPANGVAHHGRLLLSRLGDGPLISVDPSPCTADLQRSRP